MPTLCQVQVHSSSEESPSGRVEGNGNLHKLEKFNCEALTEFSSGRLEEDISEDSVVPLKGNTVNRRTKRKLQISSKLTCLHAVLV